MTKLRIARQAWADIEDVMTYTQERFGVSKRVEYEDLIDEALRAIAEEPSRGSSRASARAGTFAYHIGQPGRRARHVLFYRLEPEGIVEVIRFLHDSMDFERHL
jgi:toxin ParE1/3/4